MSEKEYLAKKHYFIVTKDRQEKTVASFWNINNAIKRVKELGEDKYKILYVFY